MIINLYVENVFNMFGISYKCNNMEHTIDQIVFTFEGVIKIIKSLVSLDFADVYL